MVKIELGAHHIYTSTSNLTLYGRFKSLCERFRFCRSQWSDTLWPYFWIQYWWGRPTTLLCIVQVYGWPHRVTMKKEELDGTNSHSEDASVHVLCLKNDKSFKHHQSPPTTIPGGHRLIQFHLPRNEPAYRMLSIHRLQTFSLLNSYLTTSLFCHRKQLWSK